MKQVLVLLLLLGSFVSQAQALRKRTVKLMGSRFDITIVAADSLAAEKNIDAVIAEVTRIENLISDWRDYTQISQVNKNAGIAPVKVDPEVFALTERALRFSKITKGAFDISFAAMDRIWKFDGSMTQMPSPEVIKQSIAKVGYKNIVLDREHSTIFLKKRGMKIGFGALGEGYAADRCREMMLAKGIKAGIVNGSGDMSTWGKQPNGSDWAIGITNPMQRDTIFAVIPLRQGAVVTSGSYEKYVEFNGKRYAHIINPATGYPATGLTSVTVFGPSAETANGFSTSMMVLGKKKGLKLLKKYPEYSAILITDNGEVLSSPNLNIADYKLK
ncbi:FAD:protein FMN transferase [Adhaeribacter rhizoryzae]|uniref:FAD:protein FMN transferase n=1 Tax=Adhaeribacter rhizoryzae TaxID=2607907 RepID=A0A5M6D480_9BACT|nr:FAD:protein FMN transferase [Adhaeribacter rhizoryzae]KAA5542318.1 FAD:protein FMN transferase [Adhaeribacter rhizoryzae]